MQYLVIQTSLVDDSPRAPRLFRISVNEFPTFIDAAKFAARRPEFSILNKIVNAVDVAQLMALPQA